MNLLVLKLVLAPVIIGSASLAGRKWGPAISGWIIGLPLTSGPVIFFVTLSQPVSFAVNAVLGVIISGISLVLYVLTYSWLATRFRWSVALTGGLLAFAASTTLLETASFPLIPGFLAVCAAIVLGLRLMPSDIVEPSHAEMDPGDIPLRILIGTGFILLITEGASFLGPRLTGLLTTIPLYVTILTVFAHRHQGPGAAAHVLRGLLYGLFAFAAFFLTLGLFIEKTGITISFLSAIAVALAIQGISLRILQQKQRQSKYPRC